MCIRDSLQSGSTLALLGMTIAALFIGYHLIMGIGGADMPVAVSYTHLTLPTSAPTTISRSFDSMKPVAAAAQPE